MQGKDLQGARMTEQRNSFMDACNELRSWLRHCATSRKVAGLTPDGVIGILHLRNPSGRTMTLGLTQPLTEMTKGKVFPL